jgi:D-alanyl-D-alanine carboxypeptidase
MPEYDSYWHIPAIQLGKRVMRNYNSLIDRYPGADGMKTGFICASGFNLVASATRNGRRLIAVVLGAPSSGVRAVKTAQLLERGFNGGQLSWLTPSLGTVNQLVPINAAPPNLRDEMCGKHRKRPAAETEDDEPIDAKFDPGSPQSVALSSLRAPIKMSELLGQSNGSSPPVVVYIGAAKGSPAAQPATASAKSKRNAPPAIPAAPAATNAINAAAPKAAAPQQLPTTAFAAVGDAPITTPSTFVAPAAAAEAPRPAVVPIPRPRPSGKRSESR